MSDAKNGGRAFPVLCNVKNGSDWVARDGMSLRDWFAGRALAMLADPNVTGSEVKIAEIAYRFADAMLEARK